VAPRRGDRLIPWSGTQRSGRARVVLGSESTCAPHAEVAAAVDRRRKGGGPTLNEVLFAGFMPHPSMRDFVVAVQGAAPSRANDLRKDGTVGRVPGLVPSRDTPSEFVIAENDVKLRHLATSPEGERLVFEAVPPFRAVSLRAEQPILTRDGAQQAAARDRSRVNLGEERREEVRRLTHAATGVLLRVPGGSLEGVPGPNQGDSPVLTTAWSGRRALCARANKAKPAESAVSPRKR